MCKVPYTSHELAVTRVSPELAVTRITIIPSLQAPLLPRGSPDPAEPSFKPVKITSCSLGVLAKVLDRKHHVCFPVLSCVLWWFLELKKVPFPCYVNILSLHGAAKLLQLCPILCNPMDCSPSGSSVHGMLQARILEWVVMPSSRGSSCISCTSCIGRQVLYH